MRTGRILRGPWSPVGESRLEDGGVTKGDYRGAAAAAKAASAAPTTVPATAAGIVAQPASAWTVSIFPDEVKFRSGTWLADAVAKLHGDDVPAPQMVDAASSEPPMAAVIAPEHDKTVRDPDPPSAEVVTSAPMDFDSSCAAIRARLHETEAYLVRELFAITDMIAEAETLCDAATPVTLPPGTRYGKFVHAMAERLGRSPAWVEKLRQLAKIDHASRVLAEDQADGSLRMLLDIAAEPDVTLRIRALNARATQGPRKTAMQKLLVAAGHPLHRVAALFMNKAEPLANVPPATTLPETLVARFPELTPYTTVGDVRAALRGPDTPPLAVRQQSVIGGSSECPTRPGTRRIRLPRDESVVEGMRVVTVTRAEVVIEVQVLTDPPRPCQTPSSVPASATDPVAADGAIADAERPRGAGDPTEPTHVDERDSGEAAESDDASAQASPVPVTELTDADPAATRGSDAGAPRDAGGEAADAIPIAFGQLLEHGLLAQRDATQFAALWVAHPGNAALANLAASAAKTVATVTGMTLSAEGKRTLRDRIMPAFRSRLAEIALVCRAPLRAVALGVATEASAARTPVVAVSPPDAEVPGKPSSAEERDSTPRAPADVEIAPDRQHLQPQTIAENHLEPEAPRGSPTSARPDDIGVNLETELEPPPQPLPDAPETSRTAEGDDCPPVSSTSFPSPRTSGASDQHAAAEAVPPQTCTSCRRKTAAHRISDTDCFCTDCILRLAGMDDPDAPFGGLPLAEIADATVVESNPAQHLEREHPGPHPGEPATKPEPPASSATSANTDDEIPIEEHAVEVSEDTDAEQTPEATVWTEIGDILTQETRDLAGDSWQRGLLAELRVVSDAAAVLPSGGTVKLAASALRRKLARTLVPVPPRGPIDLRQWRRSALGMCGAQYARFLRSLPLVLDYNADVGHSLETSPRRPFKAPYQQQVHDQLTPTSGVEEASRDYLCHSVADILRGYHSRLARLRTQRRIARIAAMRGEVEDACALLGIAVPGRGRPVDAKLLDQAHIARVRASHPDRHGGDPERAAETVRLNVARDEIRAYNALLAPQDEPPAR